MRKKCEKIEVNRLREDCQNELKKAEEKCEEKAKQGLEEKRGDIVGDCEEMLKKVCEEFPGHCAAATVSCYAGLESKHKKTMAEEMMKCKHQEGFIKLGDVSKLSTKEVLDAFYPELDDNIINKIENETYFVRQFGMDVNNLDNGRRGDDPVTCTGNIDKSCFFNISGNSSSTESYGIKKHGGPPFSPECHNKIFDKDTYLQIVKAVKSYSDIDKCKSLVTVSQKEPLIIANSENGKLVTKSGTVTKVTYDTCKQLWDEKGRIFDCTDKGEDCKVCQNSIWDFQGEVNVYADGCQLT